MGDDFVLDPARDDSLWLLSLFVVMAVLPTAEFVRSAVLQGIFRSIPGALALHWVLFLIASVVIGVP